MIDKNSFIDKINSGYQFKGESIILGTAMVNGEVVANAKVNIPLATLNRHGLITGATGTGKTKTLQLFAELLSDASVPVLMMDIKGDLSGLAAQGEMNSKLAERCQLMNIEFSPKQFPVELLTLSNEPGVKLRATVTEFGPILLSKILGLNDTQGGIISLIFKYCDEHQMPLLDLEDLQKMLQWVGNEGKAELAKDYGTISSTSVGTIMRKIVELQQQGAQTFFGEPSFDTDDLMRITNNGTGYISLLRVTDLQDRPKLFSTFMLQLLSELYATLPEAGDLEAPKLVMVIDEAHLIFSDASDALLQQLETVIKLIRSKGVGIFFCTQNPMDIPKSILGQLGLKIQHALRAFTANDRKSIKLTAENFPLSEFYNTEDLITHLGIGEALVTLLNEKGIPTPLVQTMIHPPRSRMDILNQQEIAQLVSQSKLVSKYQDELNRESAAEILSKKIITASENNSSKQKESKKEEKSIIEIVANNTVVKSMLRTAGNTLVRSLLGSLGLSGSSSKKKKSSWF